MPGPVAGPGQKGVLRVVRASMNLTTQNFCFTLVSERDNILGMAYGQNKINEYESRLRREGDVIKVFCKHCNEWKSSNGFHMSKGKFKSICKDCHNSRYSKAAGYQSPSHRNNQEKARKRKQKWLSEPQVCTMCGDTKPRIEFYNEKQNRYLPYCCSTRRSWEEIERDISEQMKTCFECGMRLPFGEFNDGGNGRDGKRPYCKYCQAARQKLHAGRDDRKQIIREVDDGTLSVKVLSDMLRKAKHCSHCGIEMTMSYPVAPSHKTIDHNVPLSRGGLHSINNVSVICLSCNSSKQTRTMEEFAKVVKKKRQV